jgi:O-antigen ligase
MLGLFTNIGGDQGVTSRTESYGVAVAYIAQSPWFGRGIGTFLPTYRIFDNQYLLSLVEIGVVGVVTLLIMIMTALWCTFQANRRSGATSVRQMSVGLAASVATGAVCLALFDGFSFPMMPGLWFLMIGLAGACYGVTRPSQTP